ncbi:GIY-YIG nuclease family protein [Cryobacterium sp. TMT2-15-1]|uniref:GIY-YIG nuclease family protein n=1 Tax=Cryobacterium sp. TMT2-15-1 TaxID=1259246 RepID=UPI0018E07EF1|nr:GIY-YIG nuclease family protein [Cryobacterium sp. TMT2-15-1]
MADDLEDWLDMSRHRERHQNNNLDRAEFLLTFAQYYPYGPQYVIFGGFFQVRPIVPEIIGGPGDELELLDQYSEYIKRLIVKLERPVGRDLYLRWYGTLPDSKLNPEVYELAPDTKLGTFPGYQNVRLRHHELQRIIANDEPSWKDALSSVKGAYVITGLSDGRLYVGSAAGEANGLWQRWAGYAHLRNLTGGNKELERMRSDLHAERSGRRPHHRQLPVLHPGWIFDPKTQSETILQRESSWKLALDSRGHGINRN